MKYTPARSPGSIRGEWSPPSAVAPDGDMYTIEPAALSMTLSGMQNSAALLKLLGRDGVSSSSLQFSAWHRGGCAYHLSLRVGVRWNTEACYRRIGGICTLSPCTAWIAFSRAVGSMVYISPSVAIAEGGVRGSRQESPWSGRECRYVSYLAHYHATGGLL